MLCDGSFFYVLEADFNGVDRFTYRVNDGTVDSKLAEVRLQVTLVDDAPVFTSTPPDAVIGAAGLVNPQAVFTYQAHASGADGDTLTYSLLEGPSGAKIDAQTGLLIWEKPTAGTVTFRILVNDGKGGQAEQLFSVNFKKPSDAGKSACISLTSIFHCGDDGDKHDDRILVINQGKDRQCAKVDWDGCAPSLGKAREDDWVAEYFMSQSKTKTLAETTGLKVGKR